MTTRRNTKCHISKQLDAIRMTPTERNAARASLEQGMRLADALICTAARLRSFADWVRRALRGVRTRREPLTH